VTGTVPPSNGYSAPALAAGRPIGGWVYVLALALAGGADLAAFHQVVALLMRREADWLIWLLVAGFTAAALTLADVAGRLWRGIRAGDPQANLAAARLCAGLWLGLGAAAFTIRLLVRQDSAAGEPLLVDQAQIGERTGFEVVTASALLFLALYLAAGMVALVGAYLTHNPLLHGYQRAKRAHRRAVRRLRRSAPAHERARQVLDDHLAAREWDNRARQAARDERFAQADELKRYAEALIAVGLQDPSATDAITGPDRRPWTPDEKRDEPTEPAAGHLEERP
jgi:hypothetical protein